MEKHASIGQGAVEDSASVVTREKADVVVPSKRRDLGLLVAADLEQHLLFLTGLSQLNDVDLPAHSAYSEELLGWVNLDATEAVLDVRMRPQPQKLYRGS